MYLHSKTENLTAFAPSLLKQLAGHHLSKLAYEIDKWLSFLYIVFYQNGNLEGNILQIVIFVFLKTVLLQNS